MTGRKRKRSETVPTAAMPAASLTSTESLDLAVPPYCSLTDADKQAVQAFEAEVIDRLYVLSADRAREEERLGLAKKAKSYATTSTTDATDAEASPKPRRSSRKKPAVDAPPTKDHGELVE